MIFKKKRPNVLNGAWEERGVIGTRIEIAAPKITVLWRNAPVLETTFREEAREGGVGLRLNQHGMRYEGANSDYAELTDLFFHDGKLEITEFFPITGESKTTLERTENSRYGDYDVCDEVLKELQGEWKDDDDWYGLRFDGDKLIALDAETRVTVLRSRSDAPESRRFRVVDRDPSKYHVLHLARLDYVDGELTGSVMVCDASPHVMRFSRV